MAKFKIKWNITKPTNSEIQDLTKNLKFVANESLGVPAPKMVIGSHRDSSRMYIYLRALFLQAIILLKVCSQGKWNPKQ